MGGIEAAMEGLAMGDLVLLRSSSLNACGYVVRLIRRANTFVDYDHSAVVLSHEDPAMPMAGWEAIQEGFRLSGCSDVTYNLSRFDDYVVIAKNQRPCIGNKT